MLMVYVIRAGGENADISYDDFWQSLCAFVEVSIGVSISGTFSLPKFFEAEGPKLRAVFSRLRGAVTSGRRLGIPLQWKADARVASQELDPDDTFTMIQHSSESKIVASMNYDHDVER